MVTRDYLPDVGEQLVRLPDRMLTSPDVVEQTRFRSIYFWPEFTDSVASKAAKRLHDAIKHYADADDLCPSLPLIRKMARVHQGVRLESIERTFHSIRRFASVSVSAEHLQLQNLVKRFLGKNLNGSVVPCYYALANDILENLAHELGLSLDQLSRRVVDAANKHPTIKNKHASPINMISLMMSGHKKNAGENGIWSYSDLFSEWFLYGVNEVRKAQDKDEMTHSDLFSTDYTAGPNNGRVTRAFPVVNGNIARSDIEAVQPN